MKKPAIFTSHRVIGSPHKLAQFQSGDCQLDTSAEFVLFRILDEFKPLPSRRGPLRGSRVILAFKGGGDFQSAEPTGERLEDDYLSFREELLSLGSRV